MPADLKILEKNDEIDFHSAAWRDVAADICRRQQIAFSALRRVEQGENVIFLVDNRFVVKIFLPTTRNNFARERAALEFASGKTSIETPEIIAAGEIENWQYLIITQLRGRASRELWFSLGEKDQIAIAEQIGATFSELRSYNAPQTGALAIDWENYVRQKAASAVETQRALGASGEWLDSLPAFLEENLKLLPADFQTVFLHGDVHALNLLFVEKNGRWRVGGLIDFGDSFCGFPDYEFVAPGVLMTQGRSDLQRAMLSAGGYAEHEINEDLRARLMLMTVLYECADLRKYALRLAPEAVNLPLAELTRAIWAF